MRVSVKTGTDTLEVAGWEAADPENVVGYLNKQLAAAAAIWPELKDVVIVDKRQKSRKQT